jgi:hypothetical protein
MQNFSLIKSKKLPLEKEEEMKMLNIVKFKLLDGVMPKKSFDDGGSFHLYNAIDINFKPLVNTNVNLGVICNLPVFIQSRYGVWSKIIPSGQELYVVVSSPTNLSMSRNEVIASCFVIHNIDIGINTNGF